MRLTIALLSFFAFSQAISQDTVVLANGQELLGSVTDYRTDGIVFQPAAPGARIVKYQWNHLAPAEVTKRKDIGQKLLLAQHEAQERQRVILDHAITPDELARQAFSAQGRVFTLLVVNPRFEEVETGKFMVRFDYSVRTTTDLPTLHNTLASKWVLARVSNAENKEIEILGNAWGAQGPDVTPMWVAQAPGN